MALQNLEVTAVTSEDSFVVRIQFWQPQIGWREGILLWRLVRMLSSTAYKSMFIKGMNELVERTAFSVD